MGRERKKTAILFHEAWWEMIGDFSLEQLGRLLKEAYTGTAPDCERADRFDDDPEIRKIANFIIEQIRENRAKKQDEYDRNSKNAADRWVKGDTRNKEVDPFP